MLKFVPHSQDVKIIFTVKEQQKNQNKICNLIQNLKNLFSPSYKLYVKLSVAAAFSHTSATQN